MKVSACLLSFATLGLCISLASGQDFGPEQVIAANSGCAGLYATDLDGDGDADALAALQGPGMVAWYENMGDGTFGPQQVITTLTPWAIAVFAIDLDGDMDADVLSTSHLNDTIAWYENVGSGNGLNGGSFGRQQVISNLADGIVRIHATDLDGDGDVDALSASYHDDKIAWYENVGVGNGIGGGSFGPQIVITSSANYAHDVYAADVDGDGDPDVLAAASDDTKSGGPQIAWYENQGNGNFGGANAISYAAWGAKFVRAADFDNDGDMDVLACSSGDNEVSWFENMGGGNFGDANANENVVATNVQGVYEVRASDLDGDGDMDVLSASYFDNTVAWYENQGGGVFGPQRVISTTAMSTSSIYITDTDGDGDPDVLAGSPGDSRITSYENLMGAFDCNGNGIPDDQDIADGTSGDCNGNGVPDECDLADPSYDCDANGLIDSCELVSDPALDCNGNGILDACDIMGDPTIDCNGDGIIDSCEWVDCDGNLVLDTCDIMGDPSLDWNGDGILDECTPPNYCTANPNSTGQIAVMSVSGSPIITDNNFTLTASQMPTFEWGYFLMAGSQGFIPNVGGSGGNLCLGFPFYRFSKFPTGQVISSGAGGTFSFSPNLLNLPQGVVFQIGETWDFQAWYRDGAASTSNFTDGIEVMFR